MRPHTAQSVAGEVRKLVESDLPAPGEIEEVPSKQLWAKVRECGSELWLDTGDLENAEPLWCREFSSFTTNNSLLNKEVEKGTYDGLIARAAEELSGKVPDEDLPLEIAFLLNARHGLRLVRKFGAKVSVELHTDLAGDVENSVIYGRRYHQIAPDHFYIKVPFTPAGLLAARRLEQEGIPVNCTLGFSARQNYLIAAVAHTAFVNVFLGRLNAFVADNDLGTGEMVGERAALASHRCMMALRSDGTTPTRQIAASMREGSQVLSLAGVDVLTMPLKVVWSFEELQPDPSEVSSQAGSQPEVELAPAVDARETGLTKLWEISEDFMKTVHDLREKDLERLAPENVQDFMAERGFSDILPEWSQADIEAAESNGKIPDFEHWRRQIEGGVVGLDALMTLCGLHYFAADQKAMDDRIRSML